MGFLVAGLCWMCPPLAAQDIDVRRLSELNVGIGVQMLGVYTWGSQADINGDNVLDPVDDRYDLGFRRARLSFSGNLSDTMNFRVLFAYDNVGRDRFSALRASPNEMNFQVLDAFWMWHANPRWANLTLGLFRPQVGRESMTSGFQTNSSMDKLPTQFYQRAHVVGRGSGRESGMNLGGLYARPGWSFNYNAGLFDTGHERVTGAAGGAAKWSPLLAARAAITLGEAEMPAYGIDYLVNYLNRRNGITAAWNYSRQGETGAFHRNELLGFDVLANYGPWNFNAELNSMRRVRLDRLSYSDLVWHVRGGYNFPVRGTFIEPVFSHMRFSGGRNSVFPDGVDRLEEAGLNWYINETRIKFNIHYTWQDGRGVSNLSDGRTFAKGDMVGFGLQFVF